MKRRVAVTGLGLVSCLGNDYPTAISNLQSGQSGLRAMPEWRERGLKSCVAGPIDVEAKKKAAGLPKKIAPAMSRAALYCCLAARDAVSDAGLDGALLEEAGCLVGTGASGVGSVYRAGELFFSGRGRRIDPYTVLRTMSSSASATVSNLLGIRGRSYSLSSACATSAHNIGHACELISHGLLDRAVAGGGEDVSELIAAAFQALRLALSTHYNETPAAASRPYDADRDGFVMSGGAGIVVVEELEAARNRGAQILAEIVGYAANSDGFDLVLPQPEGEQAANCMRSALADAKLEPDAIDYVNTHGTGTVHGDVAEVRALQNLFGDGVPPFSSTKSMTGHAIGAAGGLELIFALGMLKEGFLAPSINIETVDPAFAGLPIVTEAREQQVDTILSNNFGFGGTNACLVLRRFDD
ncbi:MAG: beta-ketoacyl-[acyl-carrier-protein] synthase family protein [Acidobacteriota bacterium]